MIFSVTSLPFLLNGTIQKHVGNYEYDQAFVEKIENYFYADDFSGGDSPFETTLELY